MIRAVAVVLSGRVALRVYRGPDLIAEAPLTGRQALLIASDLLNALLMPEIAAGKDAPVLDDGAQGRIANQRDHTE